MAAGREFALYNRIKNSSDTFLREWDAVEFLGKGTFGTVYRIVKNTGGVEWNSALKIIELDDALADKYKSELVALSKMANQSHVVRIEDSSEVTMDDDFERRFLLIRMELLNPLPKHGLSEAEVIKLGMQLSEALARCHSLKPQILHCDIKPDNILVSPDGDYKLSDFGEVRLMERSHASQSGGHGTPFFMSPEMHDYIGYDARSDLYSLGVTMYAMLNGGKVPFYDGNTSSANAAIRRRLNGEDFPAIEGVSSRLMEVIRKLCAKSTADRYQSAQELNEALQNIGWERRVIERHINEVELAANEAVRSSASSLSRTAMAVGKVQAIKPTVNTEDNAVLQMPRATQTNNMRSTNQVRSMSQGGKNLAYRKPSISDEKRVIQVITKKSTIIIASFTVFALLSCIVLLLGTIQNPKYRVDNNVTASVISCRNTFLNPVVKIPKSVSIDNKKCIVQCIGKGAFENCDALTSIIIPNTIKYIDSSAFCGCNSLAQMTIPKTVIYIGKKAFYDCDSLTSITLPEGIRSIAEDAFDKRYLKEIKGKSGSEAERYANENGIPFTAI